MPAKWFLWIVMSQLLPMHKKFQTNSWCHSFFEAFSAVVQCTIVDFLLTNIMTENIEQRYWIKFCQKLGNNQTEIIQKIQQAFKDEALSQTQIKEWFNYFKNGRLSVESEAHSERPSTS